MKAYPGCSILMQACPAAILSRLQIDQITLNTLIFVSLMIPVSTAILSDPFSWSHQLATWQLVWYMLGNFWLVSYKKKTFGLQPGVPTLHIPEGFRNRLISPDISEFVWSYSNPEANLGYTHNWEHVKPLYMIMLSFNNLMSSLELNGTGRTRHTLTLNDEMTEL